MDDAIDMSCWLRRGDPVLTQERIAKGDIAFNEGMYFQEYPHVIDWMLEEDIISAEGHNAGYKMLAAYTVLGNALGTNKTRKVYLSPGDEVKIDAATLYTRVMRAMSQATYSDYLPHRSNPWGQVHRILFKDVTKKDEGWIRHCEGSMREVFDKLAVVVDNISKDMVECEMNREDNCVQN